MQNIFRRLESWCYEKAKAPEQGEAFYKLNGVIVASLQSSMKTEVQTFRTALGVGCGVAGSDCTGYLRGIVSVRAATVSTREGRVKRERESEAVKRRDGLKRETKKRVIKKYSE